LRAAGLAVPILTWLHPSGIDAKAAAATTVARIDVFLADDEPVLNEVNTMPGLTAESQVPRMVAAAGLPYEKLVARLVDAATVSRPTTP
jgi:D-alanine-D-alanine ligase